MYNNSKKSFFIISAIIALVTIVRLIFTNFEIYDAAPYAAIGLFGAAFFSSKKWALIIPVIAWFASDLILNTTIYAEYSTGLFQSYHLFSFIALALIIVGGIKWFKKFKTGILSVLGSSFLAAVAFYIVSNFGVWATSAMYTKDISGLISCYVSAIPFFRNSAVSNMIYLTVMVESYKFIVSRSQSLKLSHA